MLTSPRPRLALLAVLGAILVAASLTPAASAAAQRHASPTGTGSDCSSAKPCDIYEAVEDAQAGDEVIVNPGDYELTETVAPNYVKKITIHGVAGRPRPRLLFKGPGQKGVDLDSTSVATGSTLRYVEIVQAGEEGALFVGPGASVDQVIARASGNSGGPTANIRDGAIRDSIVVASGANGVALTTENSVGGVTSTARNVTAIATGSGAVSIRAFAVSGASATLHLVNVIAYAGPAATGLEVETFGSGAQATITATHTNYLSVDPVGIGAEFVDDGGNQHSAPAFIDAGGDYRQAAGSPTIGAGLSDPIDNGAFDVDGDPRAIGTTDIGADEFVPPQPAPTPPPPSPSPAPVPQPPTPPSQPFAGVELVSPKLTYARPVIAVKLRCPAGTAGRCSGRTRLTARAWRTSARRLTLGRARFSIAPGNRAKVKVRVTRAGRRLLRRVPRLRGRAVNVASDGAGQSKTTRTAVTIRHRRR